MALTAFDTDLFPFLGGWGGQLTRAGGRDVGTDNLRTMPLDVIEKPDKFEIRADVPGVDKNDLKLSVDGDVLTIAVDKREEKEDDKEEGGVKVHRRERSTRFIRRQLRLPDNADLGKVNAKYDGGVLRVEVPKKAQQEQQQPKSIDVQ